MMPELNSIKSEIGFQFVWGSLFAPCHTEESTGAQEEREREGESSNSNKFDYDLNGD